MGQIFDWVLANENCFSLTQICIENQKQCKVLTEHWILEENPMENDLSPYQVKTRFLLTGVDLVLSLLLLSYSTKVLVIAALSISTLVMDHDTIPGWLETLLIIQVALAIFFLLCVVAASLLVLIFEIVWAGRMQKANGEAYSVLEQLFYARHCCLGGCVFGVIAYLVIGLVVLLVIMGIDIAAVAVLPADKTRIISVIFAVTATIVWCLITLKVVAYALASCCINKFDNLGTN